MKRSSSHENLASTGHFFLRVKITWLAACQAQRKLVLMLSAVPTLVTWNWRMRNLGSWKSVLGYTFLDAHVEHGHALTSF